MQANKFYMSDSFSEFPSYVERSSPRPRLFLIFFIVLLLIIAALAALYFIGASSGKNILQTIAPVSTPTPIVAVVPTSLPTPTTPQLERSELTVAILNGSGTAGAAKGVSSTLDELGYNIGTIGNAAKFTYTGITIHVKQSKNSYLSLLEKDIRDANPNASISATVDDTITQDAEVIVGK